MINSVMGKLGHITWKHLLIDNGRTKNQPHLVIL